ncbi:probable G-protein coupled receptor 88 [Pristis pectinata]|uniref:probable G-protein coupled receptor 88 n=1 Tax=Pristis pectinata TaxID=685728 RepID=UPI00223D8F63|nr:probable G-protein coupled receptor 88 [Pristis pectinata]
MGNFSNTSSCCGGALGGNLPWAVTYALLSVAGSLANLLVIYLVCSVRRLRSASNAFIVNVCAADLLVCALWMPQEAAALAQPPAAAAAPAARRAFGGALLLLGLLASLFSHSLVALNRCALITKAPAAYRDLYRRRNAGAMLAGCWLAAALLLLPWLAAQGGDNRPQPGACSWLPLFGAALTRGCSPPLGPYTAAVTAATILAQTAVLLCAYCKILRRVRVSVKRVSVLNFQIINNLSYPFARKDKRSRSYVSFVLCAFLLSTEPLLWVLLFGLFQPVPAPLSDLAWLLFTLLFVLSPYLYTRKNEEFRKSLRTVLGMERARASVGVEPAIHAVCR